MGEGGTITFLYPGAQKILIRPCLSRKYFSGLPTCQVVENVVMIPTGLSLAKIYMSEIIKKFVDSLKIEKKFKVFFKEVLYISNEAVQVAKQMTSAGPNQFS